MGRHRLSRPDGANFIGGIVANRENEIEFGRTRNSELIPAFGAKDLCGMIELLQQIEGIGMNRSLRLASSAKRIEFSWAFALQNGLGKN